MILVAFQRHAQTHVAGFQDFGLQAAAFDEGDLFFGELANQLRGHGHGGLRRWDFPEPSRRGAPGNDRDGQTN
ncbi:hypothetical protein D9M72_223670 [compost metagenome]